MCGSCGVLSMGLCLSSLAQCWFPHQCHHQLLGQTLWAAAKSGLQAQVCHCKKGFDSVPVIWQVFNENPRDSWELMRGKSAQIQTGEGGEETKPRLLKLQPGLCLASTTAPSLSPGMLRFWKLGYSCISPSQVCSDGLMVPSQKWDRC